MKYHNPKNQDLEIVERDENFVIESDANVDDKLYSSESDSLPKKKSNITVAAPPKKPVFSSSSSSSSSPLKPKMMVPKIKTLQLHTESESSEAIPSKEKKKDDDVSGPEMDVADDFWN